MQRSPLAFLAVACLVALAGCSGVLVDGGSGDSGGPTLDDVSYPPGVSDDGTNVSTLADAHSAALNDTSFALRFEVNQSGATHRSMTMAAAVGPNRDAIRLTTSGMGQSMAVYLTAEKRYVRMTTGSGSVYRTTPRTPEAMKLVPSSYSGATYLDQFGSRVDANFTPTGVREVNDTTLVVLHADGSTAAAPGSNITDYEATILVDEQGVVHRFEVSATTERGGKRVETSLSMDLWNVGETTVEEPSWLDEAREQGNGNENGESSGRGNGNGNGGNQGEGNDGNQGA